MEHAAAVEIISTLLDHQERKTSWRTGAVERVPVAAYSCPEVLAREHVALFNRLPQFVGLSGDIAEPGSYCTRSELAAPIVLTRAADGQARAFLNVCRHRGAQVAADRGQTRKLVCPYHAWTYDLDGALRHIPDQDAFPGVDPATCGLAPVPLVEVHSTLWLLPHVNSVESTVVEVNGVESRLDRYLDGMAGALAELGLDRYRHWRTERMELALNWKLVIDTFLEPYHFASLHRNSVGPYMLPNLGIAQSFGHHVREFLPRRSVLDLREVPTSQWQLYPDVVVVHVLFPNTVLVMLLDHVETWRVYPHPTDPGRCVCELDFYLPTALPAGEAKSEEYWEKNWTMTINTVLVEDFPAMAGVQRGMATGANTHLTVGTNEPAVAMFASAVAQALAELA